MERASQSPHTGQFLVGMRRLASMNEGENLDAPPETERTRCRLETHIVKVPEQRVHRRRPIPSAPTHSFATPLHRTQTAAETHSRSMAVDYSAEWLKGHSGTLAQTSIPAETASNGNDDLASCAAASEVADRLRNLVERERPVDDRPDRTGFEQLPQLLQVSAALL
jgi:hypothetical protein